MRSSRLLFITGGILAVNVATVAATRGAERAGSTTFVIRDDDSNDTVAVEQVTRAPDALTADLRVGQGSQPDAHAHYVVHYATDGQPQRVEIIQDTRGFYTGTISFAERPGVAPSRVSGLGDRVTIAPPKSIPIIGISVALMEQAIRALHPAGTDTASTPSLNIRNRVHGMVKAVRLGRDSVAFICDGCQRPESHQEFHFALSRDGEILGGTSVNQHWTVTRIAGDR